MLECHVCNMSLNCVGGGGVVLSKNSGSGPRCLLQQQLAMAFAETAHAKQRVSGTLCALQPFSQQGAVLKNLQRLSPTLMERSVFFEGAVPVRLQQYDREERMADLTVHVLQAASAELLAVRKQSMRQFKRHKHVPWDRRQAIQRPSSMRSSYTK